jgi:hypothetical protein
VTVLLHSPPAGAIVTKQTGKERRGTLETRAYRKDHVASPDLLILTTTDTSPQALCPVGFRGGSKEVEPAT